MADFVKDCTFKYSWRPNDDPRMTQEGYQNDLRWPNIRWPSIRFENKVTSLEYSKNGAKVKKLE